MKKVEDLIEMYSVQRIQEVAQNFYHEIQKADKGIPSSLPYIHNPLQDRSNIKGLTSIQVMVIGGSIYKVATVKIHNEEIEIVSSTEYRLPLMETEEILMKLIDKHVDSETTYLALNFAYPLDPMLRNEIIDGRLIKGMKGHTFKGLVGKLIGETVEIYFKKMYQRTLKVSCANDTGCMMYSDLNQKNLTSSIAGVVGTGINFTFVHNNEIINLESENFPGYEYVAGSTLYKAYNIIAQQLNLPEINESIDLEKKITEGSNDERLLATIIIKRSAAMTAAQIAGIALFKREHEVNSTEFNMQGSLFWNASFYKETVQKYLNDLDQKGVVFRFIEQSDIRGSAHVLIGIK